MQFFDNVCQTVFTFELNDSTVECKGYTPCLVATKAGQHDELLFLLEKGADPNMMYDRHETDQNCGFYSNVKTYPLFFAVQQGNLEIVKLLLEFGANPNLQYFEKIDDCDEHSVKKYTALELAIHLEKHDIVALLENKSAENFYYLEESCIISRDDEHIFSRNVYNKRNEQPKHDWDYV